MTEGPWDAEAYPEWVKSVPESRDLRPICRSIRLRTGMHLSTTLDSWRFHLNKTRPQPTSRLGKAGLAVASLATAALLAAVAPSAPAEIFGPGLVLGPTSIVNGTAVISGTVGAVNSGAELTVNGQKLLVDSGGRFAGTVNLGGQSNLVISLKNPVSGKEQTTTIPLNTNIVGPGGLIGPEILEALEKAGVELFEPIGGTGGLPITISGSVDDPSSLAGLQINGQDVLGALGSDRTFTVNVPGTTKEITLSATDNQGVNHYFTVPATATAGSTVAAENAQGVRIAKVRYITKSVKKTKRFRMIVTVRDNRGLLIRGATVSVKSAQAGRIVRNPKAKKTNKVGQIAFLLKAKNRAFGKRLVMVTLAKTPKAKATKKTSVRMPRLARKAAARK